MELLIPQAAAVAYTRQVYSSDRHVVVHLLRPGSETEEAAVMEGQLDRFMEGCEAPRFSGMLKTLCVHVETRHLETQSVHLLI